MVKKTVYIIALEFGVDNVGNDLTYNKLLEHLHQNNITLNQEMKRYFHVWFYENFYVDGIYPKIKDFKWTSGDLNESVLSNYDNDKAVITGDSHQKYIDYLELKVAYDSSRQATLFALLAIAITIVIGIIQICIAVKYN